MMRYPDWTQRFDAVVLSYATRPYGLGRSDCALFVADVVQAMTGKNGMRGFRGRYKGKRALQKVLRDSGGTLAAAVGARCQLLGFAQIPVQKAQRGDILYGVFGGSASLGVVGLDGRKGWTTPEDGGLVALSLKPTDSGAWTMAWRVD